MKEYRPAPFFSLALILSYVPWITAAAAGLQAREVPGTVLIAFGGLGPTISALVCLYALDGPGTRREYSARLRSVKPLLSPVSMVVLSAPLSIGFVSAALSGIVSGGPTGFPLLTEELASPSSAVRYMLFILLFGPIPEELGWRGYGVRGLLARTNGINAAAISCCVWSLWHLPLFFIGGYPLADIRADDAALVRYFASMPGKSVLITYLSVRTGSSIPASVLFHFFINFFGSAVPMDDCAEWMQVFFYSAAAILVAPALARSGPASPVRR